MHLSAHNVVLVMQYKMDNALYVHYCSIQNVRNVPLINAQSVVSLIYSHFLMII